MSDPGSEHGCCPDGETPATGPEFEGCGEVPGQECSQPKVEGNCDNANFTGDFHLRFKH